MTGNTYSTVAVAISPATSVEDAFVCLLTTDLIPVYQLVDFTLSLNCLWADDGAKLGTSVDLTP